MSGDNLFWDDLVQRSLRGPVWAIVTILSIEERFLVFWDLWKKKQFLRTKVETTKRCHTKSRSRVVHHGDSAFPVVPQAKRVSASGLFDFSTLIYRPRILDNKIYSLLNRKNRETNSAASPQAVRLPLPMFALVTIFWPLTCKTSKMLHFWMLWNSSKD